MARMNIPLSKTEIMEIMNLNSLPRDWKRNGTTITELCGTYSFKSGYALCLFSTALQHFSKKLPDAYRPSLVDMVFNALSSARPDLFIKVS